MDVILKKGSTDLDQTSRMLPQESTKGNHTLEGNWDQKLKDRTMC